MHVYDGSCRCSSDSVIPRTGTGSPQRLDRIALFKWRDRYTRALVLGVIEFTNSMTCGTVKISKAQWRLIPPPSDLAPNLANIAPSPHAHGRMSKLIFTLVENTPYAALLIHI